jgi:hypothetical protein
MYFFHKTVINGMDKVRRAFFRQGVVSRNKIPFSEMDNGLCQQKKGGLGH